MVLLFEICGSATLPSGVTFAERFRIPNSTEGLILANGRAPRLLTPWALETRSNLLSYVERNTKLEIRTIDDVSTNYSCSGGVRATLCVECVTAPLASEKRI